MVSAWGTFVINRAGNDVIGYYGQINAAGGANRWAILCDGDAHSFLGGNLTLAPTKSVLLGSGSTAPFAGAKLEATYDRAFASGVAIKPSADTGPGNAVAFFNAAETFIGSITTTATATAYNTSSDGRLKAAVEALPDALQIVQQLRPVQFRWKATGEVGQGFVAQEVQPVVPLAVQGSPDDPAPTMQMDLSKLVPHLVGAVQDLAQQVQALTGRLAALEGA